MVFATMNPKNKAALVDAVDEVLTTLKNEGFTKDELAASITTYEKRIESTLGEDASLCGTLKRYGRRGVDLQFLDQRVDRVRRLTVEQINAAAKKLLTLVNVVAGDFPESTETRK